MTNVLLPPVVASAVRDTFAADTAIDSVVWDFDMVPDAVYGPDTRFVAIYRAPAGRPGDFMVLGGFADPDVANFALLNRNALKADDLVGVDDTVDKLFAKWSAGYVAELIAKKDGAS